MSPRALTKSVENGVSARPRVRSRREDRDGEQRVTQQAGPAQARSAARENLRRALANRSGKPIGTPLQILYSQTYPRPVCTVATTFWGAEMQIVLPELVSCEIHRHGVIEPGLTALFIEAIDDGTVVYDVGAHLGYYSLLASSLGAKVHAFEPSKATLPMLRSNVGNDVTISATGLWSAETTLPFNDYGDRHSAVSTFLAPKDEEVGDPEAVYAVALTTIDRYAERTGAVPHLIKIDAEGAELEVLRGAARTIASAKPLITIEVGDAGQTDTSRQAIDFAAGLGYAPYEMTAAGTLPHAVRNTYSYGNILLVAPPKIPPHLQSDAGTLENRRA